MKKLLFIFLFLFNIVLLASCANTNVSSSSVNGASSSSAVVDDYKLTVVAPQGAPAIALANVALNNKNQYAFIDAETIGDQFTVTGDEAKDIIVAPVNAGAKLFAKGKSTYRLGAVLTWGNIFIATQRTDIQSLSDLNGKEITIFKKKSINASIVKYVLSQNNITCTYKPSMDENGDYTAAQTKEKLISDENAIVVTAEPALTTAVNSLKQSGKTVKSFSIQELYKNISGSDYTQAGLFIKASTITNHKSVVDKYLDDVEASCDLFKTDLNTAINNVIALEIPGVPKAAPVLQSALPKCNIKYVSAKDAKADVEKTANIDLSQFGGAVPSDGFYYNK